MAEYSIEFTHIPQTLKQIKRGSVTGPKIDIVQAYRTCWELESVYESNPQLVKFNLIRDGDVFMNNIQLMIGEKRTVFDAIQTRFEENIKTIQKNNGGNNEMIIQKRNLYRQVSIEIQEALKPGATSSNQSVNRSSTPNQSFQQKTQSTPNMQQNDTQKESNQFHSQPQPQPQVIEKIIKEKEKGSIVKMILIILLFFYGVIITILFLTGFGQKTLYVSEENPLLEAYRSALTIGAKDGAERLDTIPKDRISKKDHSSIGLIYIRNGEYDKALNYLSKNEVEELLFEGEDISTLQSFNEEHKTDLGTLDIAILSKKYEDIITIFEAKEDWKLTEKRLAYISLAYLHQGDTKKAEELADKTNSASLKQKISDYKALKDNIKTYEEQLEGIKDDSNKASIENKISETNQAIEQLFE